MGPVKVQPPFINPMIEILVAAKVFHYRYLIVLLIIDEFFFNLIETEIHILIVTIIST